MAEFVRDHMRSVWAVQLLLRLRRDSAHCWSPEALVAELRASKNLRRGWPS
ncbi:MAG: hypothetical protein JNL41_10635 [Phenylobacterium sp.]|uniref:hypothetical protein n=1 Tax=Phenylobacterium sp. TaxID=1871053 RepID=UPI001A3C59E3|nr:hypothetical protein [Phenylobacterium sp.]MBL8554724.1 hypothetical protein [Phenylobacterium sp.]